MSAEKVVSTIKRCADYIAGAALLYPLLSYLWADYQNEPAHPVTFREQLVAASAAIIFPALIWLWWRHVSDPPGSHPYIDKLVNDAGFRTRCVVAVVIVFAVIRVIIQLTRR